jgi:predicted RNase H-like nuclease (RuvC/YqgF family)
MVKKFTPVGPEYLALAVTAIVAGVSGGTWTANKILSRFHERMRQLSESNQHQRNKIDHLEDQISRMPLDYVLKVDFLREIQQMHDNFKQINSKLDKMMERLLK